MLRRGGMLLAAAVLAVSVVAGAPARSTAPTSKKVALSSLEVGVLGQINELRRARGLAPLRISAPLTAAARQHSHSMAARGYFSHDSADGGEFWRRIKHYYGQSHTHLWSVGENLLWSSPDIEAGAALKMWLDSPPHRQNLLTSRWREIGISAVHVASAPGTYGGQPVTIITTDFGVRH